MNGGEYVIVGMLIGAGLPLLRDWLSWRKDITLERLKIHDKDKLEAHKKLFAFARRLANETFPLAEDKANRFRKVMKTHFEAVDEGYIYFDKEAQEILDHCEEAYVCINEPDLVEETDNYVSDFLRKKIFNEAKMLKKVAKKGMRL